MVRRYYVSYCVLLGLLIGCTTVPLTGRQQLVLLPDSQLTALSVDEYAKVLSESKISTNRAETAMVNRVGQRLADATNRYLAANRLDAGRFDWEFTLIEDDNTVNAWCMPGGKVAVYSGILPVAQDDTGLAVVMSHEIAHAIARHGNERMSQALLLEAGETAASQALQSRSPRTIDLFQKSYGVAGQLGVLMPYSRKHEAEADRIGLTLMAIAGYDPREAVPFWQRMNQQGGPRPPQFLSTHPAPANRVQNIQVYLPEAMAVYQQNAGR